jgi:uncharacterized protein YndB with AHSA1/START domain/predicted pyridoxine 5'-phosphate oxidase superfamily flavin-nucleotide-binding protein
MTSPDRPSAANTSVSIALVRRLNASVHLAYTACTHPKWLSRWLTPGAGRIRSARTDLRCGGTFRLDGTDPDGAPYEVSGHFTEIIPNKRIVLTWNYDGANAALAGSTSKVEIELRGLGEDACELTLTHSQLSGSEAGETYQAVWGICLDRLQWSSDPKQETTNFHVPFGAIADIYGDRHRALQDAFDSRRLANRLRKVTVSTSLDADQRGFVAACDMVFLSTVDHRGFPTCSYKGGAPGFVRVADERTLLLPSYDGNGMYLSTGNVSANPKIGLLFIDFENPRRLRIHGTATIQRDQAALTAFPGAELVMVVRIVEIFPNCPRYVHRYRRVAASPSLPDNQGVSEVAPWKNLDFIRDAIPHRDRARLEKAGVKPVNREQYLAQANKGDN